MASGVLGVRLHIRASNGLFSDQALLVHDPRGR
jgi:hypothetical protein